MAKKYWQKELAEVLEEVAKRPITGKFRRMVCLVWVRSTTYIHATARMARPAHRTRMVEAISMKRWVKVEIVPQHGAVLRRVGVVGRRTRSGAGQGVGKGLAASADRLGLGVFFMCRRQKYPSRLSPQEIALRGSVSGSSALPAGPRTQVVAEA